MTTAAQIKQTRQLLPFFLATLSAMLIACLLVEQARNIDSEVFSRLLVAFGATDEQIRALRPGGWISLPGLLNGAGFLLFSAASMMAIYKILDRSRSILVILQLIVLSVLYQWALWQFLAIPGHPLGFAAAVALGAAAGAVFRTRETERRSKEKQYYELMLRNKELAETRIALIKQDEVERRMLAADLHDQVLNDLKQVLHRFENFAKEPTDTENAEKIRSLTNQVMREIREVMDSLCPSVLEHLGLGAAIEDCLRRGSERSNFKVRFRSKIDQEELAVMSLIEQSLLYRLVQESVTNICKHADAKKVSATMEKEADTTLVVRITDDGKGIDPGKMRSDSRGLRYMRLRAELIGATISWMAGDNAKGTTVEIRVNLAGRKPAVD